METRNIECTERDRLLENFKRATLASVAEDNKAKAAAASSCPADISGQLEKRKAAEEAMGKAGATHAEHRRSHGC